MRISKKDAIVWMRFFAALPEGETLHVRQQEILSAILFQLEDAVESRREVLRQDIPGLKTLKGRSFYVGPDEKFPGGCRSCLLGTGLGAIRRTNRCNLNCPFCYDFGVQDEMEPVGEGMWEIGGGRYYERDIPLLLSTQKAPTGVAYVYLEPFLEIEQYYGVIARFSKAGVYQHLYTNGTLCTEENLRALGDAGLDELRFNLGASGCADKVIESMALAKRYIPKVGIETPMTPDFEQRFQAKKDAVLAAGIDFMNCAELHLNINNLCNYEGENMYMCRRGYLSPVWSREITLRLMAQSEKEHWNICVHDCSNETKFARELNLKAHEGDWFGQSEYGCEFDEFPYEAFLPVLEDDSFRFVKEEPLPDGYRPGQIVL